MSRRRRPARAGLTTNEYRVPASCWSGPRPARLEVRLVCRFAVRPVAPLGLARARRRHARPVPGGGCRSPRSVTTSEIRSVARSRGLSHMVAGARGL